MAFPLIPFAAGIAVGALAAYGYKGEDVRGSAKKGTRWLYDAVTDAYEAVGGAVGGMFGSQALSAKGPAAAQPPAEAAAVEAPKRRGRRKKTTTTRAAGRVSRLASDAMA
jgi:hypothetical protein